MDQENKKIDQLLQIRQDGILNYARASVELIEMGVKIGNHGTHRLRIHQSFFPYLEKYNRSNLEFEWRVEYTDGEILDQFSEEEHNFSHIDQSRLKKISLISNFVYPTENQEKRVIVELDWATGIYTFMNGFISQDDLAKIYNKKYIGEKQLILFCKKRLSSTTGDSSPKYREFMPSMDEFFHYNRFVIGYQNQETKEKVMIMVYPTGNIKVFES